MQNYRTQKNSRYDTKSLYTPRDFKSQNIYISSFSSCVTVF